MVQKSDHVCNSLVLSLGEPGMRWSAEGAARSADELFLTHFIFPKKSVSRPGEHKSSFFKKKIFYL